MAIYMLYGAAAISFAWFWVHLIIGGRDVGRPLRDGSEMNSTVRAIAWYCWHLTSILIIALALMLAAGAYYENSGLIWAGFLIALAMSALGIWTARFLKQSYKDMPQGWLFVPIAVLSGIALFN